MIMNILLGVAFAVAMAAGTYVEWWIDPKVLRSLAQAANAVNFARALRRQKVLMLLILPCLWLTSWAAGFTRFSPGWTACMGLITAMMLASVCWPTFGRPLDKAMKRYA